LILLVLILLVLILLVLILLVLILLVLILVLIGSLKHHLQKAESSFGNVFRVKSTNLDTLKAEEVTLLYYDLYDNHYNRIDARADSPPAAGSSVGQEQQQPWEKLRCNGVALLRLPQSVDPPTTQWNDWNQLQTFG